MSSSISLVTFAGQTVTPQDDALIYESALGDGGIIYGGTVTIKDASTLHIAAGHGVIAGRKFTIFASDIPIPLSASGTLLGRLYIHMDLSNTATPIDILYETGNSLTTLVQDADVNIVNGVFEFNLATFDVDTSTISNLSNVYPQVQYANSGSFITVTTSDAQLYGAECQITDGVDTIYAIFDANGVAELKNVFMVGTLTISAASGIYSASTTISVPYFGFYTATIALWMATLSITTSSTVLYGQAITITDSNSQTVGTTTFSNVGTASFVVGAPDTYTLSVTYGGNTYTTSVVVSSETTYNVTLDTIPDGSSVTPTDDVQTWLACANITDKAYTTVAEVLADSTTLLALMSDNNAVDYLVRSTTWASDITADSTAMTDIGSNNYCADTLLADNTWLTAICNSTYFESVLNVKVPTMTGNTTPSGQVIFDSEMDDYGYYAFDASNSTQWTSSKTSSTNIGAYIGYKFTNATNIKKIYVKFAQGNYTITNTTFKIQGSNDNSAWTDLATETIAENLYTGVEKNIVIDNDTNYLYYRFYYVDATHTTTYVGWIATLQFYGREDV